VVAAATPASLTFWVTRLCIWAGVASALEYVAELLKCEYVPELHEYVYMAALRQNKTTKTTICAGVA